jgi:hypothetical protein
MQATQTKNVETNIRAAIEQESGCAELTELQLSLVGGGNADISLN